MFVVVFLFPVLCSIRVITNPGVSATTFTRPLNIAHRGCSGRLPEHTVAAYERAISDGADFIECDVIVTKDKEVVCLHDPWLSSTTDVATRSEFANMRRTVMINGKPRTDWFPFDFNMAQLKTLKKKQLFQDFRDTSYDGQYEIPTLQEFIDVAKGADRAVGIYPEAKYPELMNGEAFGDSSTRFEDVIVKKLHDNGYMNDKSLCFIQSFSENSVEYFSNITKIRLIQLTSVAVNNSTLQKWSKYCFGIGTSKKAIVETVPAGSKFKISGVSDFLQRAHAHGLQVHAYTFRNEDRYLAWDYGQDIRNEYEKFLQLGIDGMFTDFPASLSNYLNASTTRCVSGASVTYVHLMFLSITLLLIFTQNL